jgi:hypothetical protein
MLSRKEHWAELLDSFLTCCWDRPGEWGQFDCALFACDAVLAMTGTDLAEGFRGRYASGREALRLVREYAGGGLAELATRIATEHEIPSLPSPAMAQRGDILLLVDPSAGLFGAALGIVSLDGRQMLVPAASEPTIDSDTWIDEIPSTGLVARPVIAAALAWRI